MPQLQTNVIWPYTVAYCWGSYNLSLATNTASFTHDRMDGWLGFNGILSTQVVRSSLKFISKASGVYKTDYAFRMNVMEDIFEIRSCIEILVNDIKVTVFICTFFLFCIANLLFSYSATQPPVWNKTLWPWTQLILHSTLYCCDRMYWVLVVS